MEPLESTEAPPPDVSGPPPEPSAVEVTSSTPQPAAPAAAASPAEPAYDTVVTASRTRQRLFDSPQALGIVTPDEIRIREPRTTHQMLREETGVWFVESNQTFWFPILRGRPSDDIVFLRDGIRTISFLSLDLPVGWVDRIEILRGPAGLQYGTNGIGGVINVITKQSPDLRLREPDFGGEATFRGSATSNEVTGFGDVWGGNDRLRGFAGATAQSVGDYTGPSGPIAHSGGFEAYAGYGSVAFNPLPTHTVSASVAVLRKYDQEFYGVSKVNPSGIPQNRLIHENREMLRLEYDAEDVAGWLSELRAYGYFETNNRLSYFTTEPPDMRNITHTTVAQWYGGGGVQGTSRLRVLRGMRLVYGLDHRIENIEQPRSLESINLTTGDRTDTEINSSIPSSRFEISDAFLIAELTPVPLLTVSGGARFETTRFVTDPRPIDAVPPITTDIIDLDERWNALVWSAGAVVRATPWLAFAANVGTGYRVPNAFDLVLTQVQGNATGFVSVPSPDLQPLRSITVEGGPRIATDFVQASLTAYYTSLTDIYTRVETGETIDLPGVGPLPTRRNENSKEAWIGGLEMDVSVRFLDDWRAFGNLGFTDGLDETLDVPLPKIPPLNGAVGLRWQPRGAYIEGVVQMVAPFDDPAPDDKVDQAVATDPGFGSPSESNPPLRSDFTLPGYTVVNLRGGFDVWRDATSRRRVEVFGTIQNLFNVDYRPAFSAELQAPGTDVQLGVRGQF